MYVGVCVFFLGAFVLARVCRFLLCACVRVSMRVGVDARVGVCGCLWVFVFVLGLYPLLISDILMNVPFTLVMNTFLNRGLPLPCSDHLFNPLSRSS